MNKGILYIFLLLITFQKTFAQKDSIAHKSIKYPFLISSGSLIGVGIYSRYDVPFGRYDFRKFRNNHFSDFNTHLDDYLQFVPIGFAYGLGVLPNMKSKNDFVNKSVLLLKSELLIVGMVFPLKKWVGDRRPDSGSPNAWPSGHTSQAFVAASFLDHEYRHKSIWISIAAYSCAASVGVFRILNDRHWSADVFAGAGIGILATNIAYLTHQYKWKNFKFLSENKVTIVPFYQNKTKGIALSINL